MDLQYRSERAGDRDKGKCALTPGRRCFARYWTLRVLFAIALAAALLLGLDRAHVHLDRTNLRAAADLALLTPLVVAPFFR